MKNVFCQFVATCTYKRPHSCIVYPLYTIDTYVIIYLSISYTITLFLFSLIQVIKISYHCLSIVHFKSFGYWAITQIIKIFVNNKQQLSIDLLAMVHPQVNLFTQISVFIH